MSDRKYYTEDLSPGNETKWFTTFDFIKQYAKYIEFHESVFTDNNSKKENIYKNAIRQLEENYLYTIGKLNLIPDYKYLSHVTDQNGHPLPTICKRFKLTDEILSEIIPFKNTGDLLGENDVSPPYFYDIEGNAIAWFYCYDVNLLLTNEERNTFISKNQGFTLELKENQKNPTKEVKNYSEKNGLRELMGVIEYFGNAFLLLQNSQLYASALFPTDKNLPQAFGKYYAYLFAITYYPGLVVTYAENPVKDGHDLEILKNGKVVKRIKVQTVTTYSKSRKTGAIKYNLNNEYPFDEMYIVSLERSFLPIEFWIIKAKKNIKLPVQLIVPGYFLFSQSEDMMEIKGSAIFLNNTITTNETDKMVEVYKQYS